MKNLIKGFTLSTALVLGMVLGAVAQTTPNNETKTKMDRPARPEMNLTDAQKAQMKANHQADKLGRDKFEASLNADQKAIMQDKSIRGKEKMKKLNATLSVDQKSMMKANKEASMKNRAEFAKTLTPEQKEQFEKMPHHRGERGMKGDHQRGDKRLETPKTAHQ
jgi:Spy/CpxP family protein refolding chaperone